MPQLKINQSALDTLGIPLTTTIVSGECADDPLYVPEIRKVQTCIQRHGVLYVGNCKMAAMNTRCYVAAQQDYYLCPLPAVQMPKAALQAEPVWTEKQSLAPVYRPLEKETAQPEHIADGLCYTVTLKGDCEGNAIEWQEQILVVHSLKQAAAQEKALAARLEKSNDAIFRYIVLTVDQVHTWRSNGWVGTARYMIFLSLGLFFLSRGIYLRGYNNDTKKSSSSSMGYLSEISKS